MRLRLRSDVPVGLSLSGGLDSTAVLAGFMDAGPARPVCLTSVYGQSGQGEMAWARRAGAPYGLEPVAALADPAQWLETLETIVWHMDGPCDTPAVFVSSGLDGDAVIADVKDGIFDQDVPRGIRIAAVVVGAVADDLDPTHRDIL